MDKQNLFESWLKRQNARDYWAKHGTTYSGVPVKVLNLPNDWVANIFGPYPPPQREDYETEREYKRALRYHQAFTANLEYYWVIPYFVWGSKTFEAHDLSEIEKLCWAHASDKSNIYDPERSRVDGVWVDRANLYEARLRYKEKLDAQFEAEKEAYSAAQGKSIS